MMWVILRQGHLIGRPKEINSVFPVACYQATSGFAVSPGIWTGRRQTRVPSRSVKYKRLSDFCRACPSAQIA